MSFSGLPLGLPFYKQTLKLMTIPHFDLYKELTLTC